MTYLDTSYIVKCYLNEPGSASVLAWAAGKTGFSCCRHGRLEFVSAVKRHVREGRLSKRDADGVFGKLAADEAAGLWHWIPASDELIDRSCEQARSLPDDVFLRSADALHLTCASASGLDCIYSHDRHLLAAAPHFGLRGRDIIP